METPMTISDQSTVQIPGIMDQDPSTERIREACQSLVGATLQITAALTKNGTTLETSSNINCNAVGDQMESLVGSYLQAKIHTFENGPLQDSPDFYNHNRQWEYECKVFKNPNSNNDIGMFGSYINKLSEDGGVEKKLFRTKYLLFSYSIQGSHAKIERFDILNVWKIVGYRDLSATNRYPIGIQRKKETWYNIRPCATSGWNDIRKTPKMFIDHICTAITECPNNINNKNELISSIKEQFQTISSQ